MKYVYFNSFGKPWDGLRYLPELKAENVGPVDGILLVQLIDKRKLKLEVFPGKNSEQVGGFAENAKIFER